MLNNILIEIVLLSCVHYFTYFYFLFFFSSSHTRLVVLFSNIYLIVMGVVGLFFSIDIQQQFDQELEFNMHGQYMHKMVFKCIIELVH